MKRKHRTDEELENMLRQLPPIEDHQSKQELYHKISPEVQKTKRKMAPWIMPSLATAVVILLLAVVIPVFLNMVNSSQMEQSTSDNSASEANRTMESAEMPDESVDPENSQPSTEGAKTERESEQSVSSSTEEANQSSLDKQAELAEQTENSLVKEVLPGKNAQVIIPFTKVYENGRSEDNQAFVPSEYGLSESLLKDVQIDIEDHEKRATVTFPDDFTVNGSTWAEMLTESIRWKVEAYSVETIKLESTSGGAVHIGPYGEINELTPINNGEYYYQLYKTPDSPTEFLVPLKLDEGRTILEALMEMKKEKHLNYVSPPVPAHVKFSSVSEREGQLLVEVSHGKWSNEREVTTMIEAILMTAKQFGYENVQLDGIKLAGFSAYNLEEPIGVPERMNTITISE
ncbi:hypothetical protein [Halobacillus mangrovi]|uniref:Negative regulator of sigma-X activity n=1 Tax=Halobacillus mangrovi TaxID=402384 RepID=A0A1W5ZV87_9BACI|nr:hypothetical protein [Halobacillus mangrovi]ARI77214.1 hypothetical protein HM131_10350 [Halobacillus mangrovi]